MQRIYLDNAATTAIDPEVVAAMMPFLTEKFGNPSSIYSYGRETKMALEQARKTVAKLLNCAPSEIFFTSGGTESTNMAVTAAINDLDCTQIITSPIEHHATLHAVQHIASKGNAVLAYVKLKENGHVDLEHLEELLKNHNGRTLITLMHANNEIGNLLDVKRVGELAEQYNAIFHSDMVQTIGHYPVDLQQVNVHFASSAGHKFHGPKGVGIIFVRSDIQVKPLIHGGSQERNMRAGTENVYGIVGYAKALELAVSRMEEDSAHMYNMKNYMREQLLSRFPDIVIHGSQDKSQALYTVLNVGFPQSEKSEMLVFNLDMAGICVSGGSACSSGASSKSHVITALEGDRKDVNPIRFSFCRHTTKEEIDQCIKVIESSL